MDHFNTQAHGTHGIRASLEFISNNLILYYIHIHKWTHGKRLHLLNNIQYQNNNVIQYKEIKQYIIIHNSHNPKSSGHVEIKHPNRKRKKYLNQKNLARKPLTYFWIFQKILCQELRFLVVGVIFRICKNMYKLVEWIFRYFVSTVSNNKALH